MMKTKIIKIIVISLILLSVAVLPVFGATEVTYGTYGINGGYSLGDAPNLNVVQLNNESNLRGDKGTLDISLGMTVLINGSQLDSIYNDLYQVRMGNKSFNEVFRFGNGSWYYDVYVDTVELNRGVPQQVYSIESLKNNKYSYSFKTFSSYVFMQIEIKYKMRNEIPSLYTYNAEGLFGDFDEFNAMVNVSYNPVDLKIYSDKYDGQSIYIDPSIFTVSMTNTANYYGVSTGKLPYDVHVVSNLCVPYGMAQASEDSAKGLNVSSKIGYCFTGTQGLTDFQEYSASYRSRETNPKRFVASDCDFSLARVRYTVLGNYYTGEYGVNIPIYFGGVVNKPTPIQNQYQPYIGVFEVVDRQRVSMDVGGTVSDSYDFTHLYRKIGFHLPPIDPWYQFFTVEYLTDFIMELVNLLTSLVWNLIVWLLCESPLLSDITAPLFLAGLEAGNIFGKYILPLITTLGIFTPVIVIAIILKFVGSNK